MAEDLASVWPHGSGEMAVRIRAFDWSRTSLGPIEAWPSSLRSALTLVLDHPLPMAMGWGSDLITLYNDAYRPLLGGKLEALGRPFLQVWEEARSIVEPQLAHTMAGHSSRFQDARFTLFRGEEPEEAFFNYSLCPLRDEAGTVVGILNTAFETSAIVTAAAERLHVEKALRESEERFRAFVTASSDVVYRMSADWSEMRQLDGQGFLADTADPSKDWIQAYILAEDRHDVLSTIEDAIRDKRMFELEHRVRQADGGVGWVLSRAVPIVAADGAIIEWLGSASDVTTRKEMERAHNESEELRRIALDGGRMGTWRWNLHDQLIWGDAAFLGLWGFQPSDEPRPLADFTDRMSAPDQSEMGEIIMRAIEAGKVFDGQIAVVSGPNKGRSVRWRGQAERERPWLVNGVSFDITEQRLADQKLRESEARLIAAFESVPAGVAVIDANGKVVIANSDYKRFLPTGIMPSRDPDRGSRWRAWDVQGQQLEPDAFPGMRALRGESVVPGQDMLYVDDDGREFWTNVATAPTHDDMGRTTGCISVISDITERKATEAMVRESEAYLQIMVAELHHRTRNLMSIIVTIMRQIVSSSSSLADFQMRFTERLGALSRVQGMFVAKADARIMIADIVRLEMDALGIDLGRDRVTIAGSVVPVRKSTVQILALAIHELATNAHKYGALRGETGQLEVRWNEYRTEADKRRLRFEWIETGIDQQVEEVEGPLHRGGYGRKLIEEALPYSLKAEVIYSLAVDRLDCVIDMPLDR